MLDTSCNLRIPAELDAKIGEALADEQASHEMVRLSKSDVIRHLLVLGLAAHEAQRRKRGRR